MAERHYRGLIQFGAGHDGELQLLIAEELWLDLKEAVERDEGAMHKDGFVRVSLSHSVRSLRSVTVVTGSDNPPCPPFGG